MCLTRLNGVRSFYMLYVAIDVVKNAESDEPLVSMIMPGGSIFRSGVVLRTTQQKNHNTQHTICMNIPKQKRVILALLC